jgi:hypothetical protein
MAMKPVGQAILIGTISAIAVGGAIYFDVFSLLKKKNDERASKVEAEIKMEKVVETPAPVLEVPKATKSAPAAEVQSPTNDAIDQLIRQSGKK